MHVLMLTVTCNLYTHEAEYIFPASICACDISVKPTPSLLDYLHLQKTLCIFHFVISQTEKVKGDCTGGRERMT